MSLLSSGVLAGALSQVTAAALGPATLAVDNIVNRSVSDLIQGGAAALSNAFNPANPSRSIISPSSGGVVNGDNNKFMSIVRQLGVMRTNLFFVSMQLPIVVKNKNEELITFMAEAINLPGVNFGTTQNRRYGFGGTQKYVNDVTFNDLTVSFICDGKGTTLGTFGEWMNKIVRFDELPQKINVSKESLNPFFFEYKDNYIAPEFKITVFDETRKKIIVYEIFEAFPTQVSDITLNWGSTDEFARFTVNFSYTTWKQTSYSVAQFSQTTSPDNSMLRMSFGSDGSTMSLLPLTNIATQSLQQATAGITSTATSAFNSNVERIFG